METRPLPVDTPAGPVAEQVFHIAPTPGRSSPDDLRVRLFLRDQKLRLSIPKMINGGTHHVFRSRSPRESAFRWDEKHESCLLPRLRPCAGFVAAGELLVKAKQFDDGLLAAVEIAGQDRCGLFHGKRPLVRALLDRMPGTGLATAHLAAAYELGGQRSTWTPEAIPIVRAFLADERRSKPIGFYTWNDALERIFQQDRLLQSDLSDAEDTPALASALAMTPELRAAYDQCLRLTERATNALACGDFRPWIAAIDRAGSMPPVERSYPFPPWLALFPASRSHETDLARSLYGDRSIPEDSRLLDELIRAVRAGAIALAPRPDSGWYDWQTWALETLVVPERGEEAARLALDPSYQDHLEQLFRAGLALARETHVKQVEVPLAGAALNPPIEVAPDLRLEPLVTHYARRADGYRFIRTVLVETFGVQALQSLHRLRADGSAEPTLAEELELMIDLFDGAANVARLELGAASTGQTAAFLEWMSGRGDDPDITADLRMMVPVYDDVERRKTKVWMFLGWLDDTLEAGFARRPEVLGPLGRVANLTFTGASYPIARPVMVEALVSHLLDRDEFRTVCDRHGAPDAVLRAVE